VAGKGEKVTEKVASAGGERRKGKPPKIYREGIDIDAGPEGIAHCAIFARESQDVRAGFARVSLINDCKSTILLVGMYFA
jgi:hypothetical protein